jgi:hypothetical protein
MARDIGPVLREDPSAEGVLLAEPQSSHTDAFKAQVEAADPGEE